MASRGMDTSVLQQMTPGSAQGAPPMPMAGGAPQAMPQPQGAMPQDMGQGVPQGMPAPTSESELIIKALAERLRTLGKAGM